MLCYNGDLIIWNLCLVMQRRGWLQRLSDPADTETFPYEPTSNYETHMNIRYITVYKKRMDVQKKIYKIIHEYHAQKSILKKHITHISCMKEYIKHISCLKEYQKT